MSKRPAIIDAEDYSWWDKIQFPPQEPGFGTSAMIDDVRSYDKESHWLYTGYGKEDYLPKVFAFGNRHTHLRALVWFWATDWASLGNDPDDWDRQDVLARLYDEELPWDFSGLHGEVAMPGEDCPRNCVSPHHVRWMPKSEAKRIWSGTKLQAQRASTNRDNGDEFSSRAWIVFLFANFENCTPDGWWASEGGNLAPTPAGSTFFKYRAIAYHYDDIFPYSLLQDRDFADADRLYARWGRHDVDPVLAQRKLNAAGVPASQLPKFSNPYAWHAERIKAAKAKALRDIENDVEGAEFYPDPPPPFA